ncbi:MAG: galactose mutarotase, partial [Bacteroidales bacterium]|nr:galactose mutarotase [Bacteroidales bacterium]
MSIKKQIFGKLPDGTEVEIFTLTNRNGLEARVMTYGAILVSMKTPDAAGNLADIVLGFDTLTDYAEKNDPYFGTTTGRYANRIAKGKFTLDGTEYTIAQNNGPNHLHGGIKGFDKQVWNAKEKSFPDTASLRLRYTSPDGEEGYPGNLRVMVIYSLTNDNELIIDYKATTDKATPLNLTHHSYFNLGGTQQDALDHVLTIAAHKYVAVDENLIPTGELPDVQGTPMDFSSSHSIGERIADVDGGYDHTYVLFDTDKMNKVADVYHPGSGRAMEVFTSEPGIQFYSGNFLDGSLTGKNGVVYNQHHGFCLETQHFPDSPNQPDFP